MSVDAVEGRYNVVLAEEYKMFEHQVPVYQFLADLEDDHAYEQVCVLNLGEMFTEGDPVRLSRAMQDRGTDLVRAGATIQFAVDGSIQSVRGGFELLYEGDLYRLDKVFGAALTEHDEGWLTATF